MKHEGALSHVDVRGADEPTQPAPEFKKDSLGKAPLALLPPLALTSVAHVLKHGVDKYGRDNWKNAPSQEVFVEAALRHILAHMNGEVVDESGKPHISHAAASLLLAYEWGTIHGA